MLRALHTVMAALFLLSCAVQINDPDPLRWIAIYSVPFVFSAAAAAGRPSIWAAVPAVLFAAGWAWSMPGWSLDTLLLLKEPKMVSNQVEEAREAFGLFLCALWLGVIAGHARRSAPQPAPPAAGGCGIP